MPRALPLGELSPQVTERVHAVSPVAKVLGAIRNFPATAKSRPLGEGGCECSEQTEGVPRQSLRQAVYRLIYQFVAFRGTDISTGRNTHVFCTIDISVAAGHLSAEGENGLKKMGMGGSCKA